MSIISARRRPFPYHVVIDGVGLLLGSPGSEQAAAALEQDQDISQVAPPDFSYGGISPINERGEPYESLVLGYGPAHRRRSGRTIRYAASAGRRPERLAVVQGAADQHVHAGHRSTRRRACGPSSSSATTLYCAQGRYVLQRVNDTTLDGRRRISGQAWRCSTSPCSRPISMVSSARFVALSSGPAQYSSNGTVWTAMATFGALAFATIGREWLVGRRCQSLAKVRHQRGPDARGQLHIADLPRGDKIVGDHRADGQRRGHAADQPRPTASTRSTRPGDDHQLFPFLKVRARGEQRQGVGAVREQPVHQLRPQPAADRRRARGQRCRPRESWSTTTRAVRGKVTAFAAVGTMFAYAALFNPDTLTGLLDEVRRLGVAGSHPRSRAHPRISTPWHGSLSDPFVSRAIQSLFVSTVAAPTGHTRTYLGFSDGSDRLDGQPVCAEPRGLLAVPLPRRRRATSTCRCGTAATTHR